MHDFLLRFDEQSAQWNLGRILSCFNRSGLLCRTTSVVPTGTRLDIGTVELVELDCLTARLNEHRSPRETTPKGHIGWLREIDSQILYVEAQRERLVGHLTRQVLYRMQRFRA
jgi:hypothetical protein